MKQEETVRKIAIKRHDIDAPFFQNEYEKRKEKYDDEFIYGRYQINEELETIMKELKPGAKVLDIGSGTGHLAHFFYKNGFEVIGLEPSENMLNYARKNFPEIQFVEGISSTLPFEDNSFDLIISIEVMRYLHPDDVLKTYKEALRVLKKDGYFFATHVNTFSSDFYYFFYHLKGLIKKAGNKMYHNCYFTTAEKEAQKLKNSGFSSAYGLGRMFGSIRIGYKFGKAAGKAWAKLLEKISEKQRFLSGPLRNFAGHLFLIAQK
jgi:ubiquinone/menaquinone biosynthesis C-methylase UbiE